MCFLLEVVVFTIKGSSGTGASKTVPGYFGTAPRASRRRVNMVGVIMVPAEFIKFKHGLYKSYGIECFEGIMLESCLLQQCFHAAGQDGTTLAWVVLARQDMVHYECMALVRQKITIARNDHKHE